MQGANQHLERANLFLAFAVAMREGSYIHRRKPASGETIEEALRWVAQCMVTRGLRDPHFTDPGQHHLDASFSTYYRSCKAGDPPPHPQQAFPSSTSLWIAMNLGTAAGKRLRMVADLIILAFFFLLRVGEYTSSRQPRQTVALRRKDIRLWYRGTPLDHRLPLAELLAADAVTVCLENQKNGFRGATLHHTASGHQWLCPVKCAARLVHETQNMSPDTGIGTYADEQGRVFRITANEIRAGLQLGAIGDNLAGAGYDLSRIGAHSLRSGGATHLKILGYDDDTIKKLGRWSSNTYLRYIQSQIGNLTHGIATQMARVLRFHNVSSY